MDLVDLIVSTLSLILLFTACLVVYIRIVDLVDLIVSTLSLTLSFTACHTDFDCQYGICRFDFQRHVYFCLCHYGYTGFNCEKGELEVPLSLNMSIYISGG